MIEVANYPAKVVERAIEDNEHFEGWDEYDLNSAVYNEPLPGEKYGKYTPLVIEIEGVQIEVKVVESTGGEDQGSYASTIIQVGSQFFKKEGYYASHYGYDWDGAFFEVAPKRVTVTRYERV